MSFIYLLVGLGLILIAAEIFCNALEHLGENLGVSEGLTGSIFAAIGTALPETLIPLIAIFGTDNNPINSFKQTTSIGIGAILGAPLMLSTLSLFLMAAFVSKKRGWNATINAEKTGLLRDLQFFLLGFLLAFVVSLIPHENDFLKFIAATILILFYFFYLLLTIKASKGLVMEGQQTRSDTPLLLTKFLSLTGKKLLIIIVLQCGLGLLLLVIAAKFFIHHIENIAQNLHISSFLLSLILIPIATELPEKINSIKWLSRNKDTLALANITGAMTFQGLLLPAIGIMFTPWQHNSLQSISFVITLIASLWIYYQIKYRKLRLYHLIFNGALYGLNVICCWQLAVG